MTDEVELEGRERVVGIAFSVMVAGRVLGAAFSPLLFAHIPILLVAMSPFLVHLVFVSPLVSLFWYFPVALVVTTGQATIGFLFGSVLGLRALTWLMKRIPVPEKWVRGFLGLVRRFSVVTVFAVPGPIMGVVVGVAGVRRRDFLAAVVPAQAIWVTAAYFVGEALLEYIAVARDFVMAHAIPLTMISLTLGGLRLGYGWFKGRRRKAKS